MDAGDDVEVIARDTGYGGIFRVERLRLRHRRFAGGWTPELHHEVFNRGRAVAVVPYDPVRDAVVLIEQFRTGALVAGWAPWMTEIVAGIMHEGESAEDVARRELREETGLEAAALEPIARFMPSPGAVAEAVEMFVARVDASTADALAGLAGEGEDIRVFALPFAEALAELDAMRINNAVTLVGLHWLARHREGLRKRWGKE